MASNTSASGSAKCSLCSEFFVDPRMLQCLHSFCNKCLKKKLEEQGSGTSLECPTCQKTASLQDGVDFLPKDLRKAYEVEVAQYESKVKCHAGVLCGRCIESSGNTATVFCCNCCKFLCKACTEDHRRWRETHEHELVPVGEGKNNEDGVAAENLLKNIPHKPVKCEQHCDESLKFYCETCTMLICRDCIVLKHIGHEYNRIEVVAEKQKAELSSIVKIAEDAKCKLDDVMTQGGKVTQQVQAKQKAVEDAVKSAFKTAYDTLRTREEALLAKAAETGLGKLTALTMQNEELKAMSDDITETCEAITTAIKSYTPTEILSTKEVMAVKLQQLLKQFNCSLLEPCRSDEIPRELDTGAAIEAIKSIGIVGVSHPAASMARLRIPRAVLDKERKIVVTACDMQGKPFPLGGEKVQASLSLIGSSNPPTKAEVIDKNDGTYLVSFVPGVCGEHELNITIENQPIRGSPLHIYVRKERKYDSSVSRQSHFDVSNKPSDIAVDDNGDVYVVCYDDYCIKVFNRNTALLRTITNDCGYFSDPCGIALFDGMLYVTNAGSNSVVKITTSGEFVSEFGTGEQLDCPCGICLSSEGRIFVASVESQRIAVFEPDGTFAYHITGSTVDKSNLCSPWDVAFDPSGYLHITNYGSSDITVFTPEGKYETKYSCGVSNLAGIAIDEEGYSFVTENSSSKSRLFIFNYLHEQVHSIQAFQQAKGVAIDKDGFIYVASYDHKAVYKY